MSGSSLRRRFGGVGSASTRCRCSWIASAGITAVSTAGPARGRRACPRRHPARPLPTAGSCRPSPRPRPAGAGDLEEDDRDVVLAAARVRRVDERARRLVEVVDVHEQRLDLPVRDHRRQPVGADQVEVARLGRDRERVDVDVRLGAERPRDHRALRVHLRLLRRELAAPQQLADERVVVRELLELLVADAVGARVADVADRDRAVGRHPRARRSSSSPSRRRPCPRSSAGRRGGSPPGSATRRAPRRARPRAPPPAPRPRARLRPRPPGRRPSRPRPRRAAARRRRRPRSAAGGGPDRSAR